MYKHHVYSASRMNWIKKDKAKTSGCLFCSIARDDPRVEKEVIYKTKDVVVAMNIYPYNTGHLQVVPIRHVEKLEDLSEKEIASLFVMTQKCVKLLKKTLNPDGFNIGMNIGGDVAGASVMHLHVHVVPRFVRDSGFMEAACETKVLPQTVSHVAEKLKKNINILR